MKLNEFTTEAAPLATEFLAMATPSVDKKVTIAAAVNAALTALNNTVTSAKRITQTVLNQTGATLTLGTVVYISGANGDNPTVTKAQANAEATSSKTLGLVLADIANGAIGTVITSGLLEGVNTGTATAGQSVWLSATTAGTFQFGTPPAAPDHGVYLGKAVRIQTNNGSILVQIQNGYELEELHNVLITAAAENDTLVFNGTVWEDRDARIKKQVAPTSLAAAATLTNAQLLPGLINTTGTTYTVTLPTGATLETLVTWSAVDQSFEFTIVNTATGTITLAANGNTTLGALTVNTGVSATFRLRRTAANTFTMYRIG